MLGSGEGRKQNFAQAFQKSSCKRGVFWYFANVHGFRALIRSCKTRTHEFLDQEKGRTSKNVLRRLLKIKKSSP